VGDGFLGTLLTPHIHLADGAALIWVGFEDSEGLPLRLARNIIIESRPAHRFRCTMRVERGRRGDQARYRAVGTRACPSASTRGSCRNGARATMRVYRLAALTVGARFAVANA
jgi:hypothetical protein